MSFLLLDSTLIDDKYLENLEMASELSAQWTRCLNCLSILI